MRLHFTRVGFEEVLNLGWVGDTGVEPPVIVVGGKDDRHPVVDRRHRFVGRYGEDRAAQDFIVPQVRKAWRSRWAHRSRAGCSGAGCINLFHIG